MDAMMERADRDFDRMSGRKTQSDVGKKRSSFFDMDPFDDPFFLYGFKYE